MSGQTTPDNSGHVRGDYRTDNNPLKGVVCPPSCPGSNVRRSGEPMKSIQFVVTVQLDEAAIEREGKRYGLTLDRARQAIVADIEGRLSDEARWRDGVVSVNVSIIESTAIEVSR